MKWNNLSAVVTGGGSGIGRCVCIEFVRLGCNVIISDINKKTGEETLQLINNEFGKGKALFIQGDTTSCNDIQNSIELCKETFGSFDIMCNNAGIGGSFGSFNDTENIDFGIKNAKLVININLEAVILGTMLALKTMRKLGNGGVIINTASMGGIFPMPYNPVYAATKSGVIQFTRSLENLSSENIRVSAICPTYTVTPLTALDDTQQERMKKEIGGKMLLPEQVAEGFKILVEDPNSGGKIMRVTPRGVDYWFQKSQCEPITSKI